MSGVLDEVLSNNTHSTSPPRKRSRHDSGYDSSPGSSDGSVGGGGSLNQGSISNDNDGDSREAGSQKRARSEGIGESDNSLGSVSWSRGNRLPSPSVNTTRHSTARTAPEASSADSLTPLPAFRRSEVQWESEGSDVSRQTGSSNGSLSYTARDDLARSMEFDQQIDALRHSPPPIPLSPSLASQATSTADANSEIDLALEQRQHLISPGGQEEFELQSHARGEVLNASGRLHTLADTASIHARMSRPLGHSLGSPRPPPLDPIIVSDTIFPRLSNEPSALMPHSRLRLSRRTEHILSRSNSLSPLPQISPIPNEERQPFVSSEFSLVSGSQRIEDVPSPHVGAVPSLLSSPAPPSVTEPLQSMDDSIRDAHPLHDRRVRAPSDWFQDLHNTFEPFETAPLDQHHEHPGPLYTFPPESDRLGELICPALNFFIDRRRSDRSVNRRSSLNPTFAIDPSTESDAFRHSNTLVNNTPPSLTRSSSERSVRAILADRRSGTANISESHLASSSELQTGIAQTRSFWIIDPEHGAVLHRDTLVPDGRRTVDHIDDRRWHASRNDYGRTYTEPDHDSLRQIPHSQHFSTAHRALTQHDTLLQGRSLTETYGDDRLRSLNTVLDAASDDVARTQTDLERNDMPRRPESNVFRVVPTHHDEMLPNRRSISSAPRDNVTHHQAGPAFDDAPQRSLQPSSLFNGYITGLSERIERSPDRGSLGIFDGGERRSPRPRHDLSRDDIGQSQGNLGSDGAPQQAGSLHNIHHDERQGTIWGSRMRSTGVPEADYMPTAGPSFSSIGRSSSRSLLDPTLRFGSGSAAYLQPSWSSGSERESDTRLSRLRRGFGSDASSWWDMESDTDPFDLDRISSGHHSRHLGRGTRSSSYLSSMGFRDTPATDDLWRVRRSPFRALASRPPFRMNSGHNGSLGSATEVSGISESWLNRPRGSDSLDQSSRQSGRLDASPPLTDARSGPQTLSFGGPRRSDATIDFSELVGESFRETLNPPIESEEPSASMEGIFESHTRGSTSSSAHLGRATSVTPFTPSSLLQGSRPLEPRLSLDAPPQPNTRLSPRRFRPLSPIFSSSLVRHDNDSPDTVPGLPTIPNRVQRHTERTNQALFAGQGLHSAPALDRGSVTERHSSLGERFESRNQLFNASSPTDAALDSRRRQPSSMSQPPRSQMALMRGTSETFSELVRRRAARADTQAQAARRSPSPERVFRSASRIPRPSSLFEEAEATRRRERVTRLERRHNTVTAGQGSSIRNDAPEEALGIHHDREHVRQEMNNAGLLLERSVAPRHVHAEASSRTMDSLRSLSPDRDRPSSISRHQSSVQHGNNSVPPRRMTSGRQRSPFLLRFPDLGSPFSGQAESEDNNQDREQLREAIIRRSRDDEDARRALSHLGRSAIDIARDPMSHETTRNLQRRLRESEVEMSRALRALDQWGELEGSSERDVDVTQSRMNRFGETMRRRRLPPAFHFATSPVNNDSISGVGSSSSARQGRRSPSPVARLQSRQARFARAQGRFRELSADVFGESRTRGPFVSRLDMLGGSRMSSRFLSRSLGDYMRDEDFDASYENLVRLAAVVGDAKPRGTPAHLLAAMPSGFYKDFVVPGCETRCPICLDDYKELDPVLRITDCDHWFHKECLQQWLHGARSCPLCKGVVRGRVRGQKSSPDDAPGPSGSRRDSGSDDEGPSRESGRRPALTLEELGSYAGSTAGY